MTILKKAKTCTGAICDFTGMAIIPDADRSDMAYLCSAVSYQAYEDRLKAQKDSIRSHAREWKFAYMSKHPVAERKRSKFVV